MKENKNNKLESDALESVTGGTKELDEISNQIKSLSDQIGLLCDQWQQKCQARKLGKCSISDLEEASRDLHSKVNLLREKVIERDNLIDAKIG